MPVILVQNAEPNPTIFTKGEHRIVWQRNGDEFGDDIQRVPASFMEDPDFLRSLDIGTLTLLDGTDEDVKQTLAESGALFQARRKAAADRATEALTRTQNSDIIGLTCIGPAAQGRSGVCGAQVILRAARVWDVPPLCSRHQGLAHMYFLYEEGSRGQGAQGKREGAVVKEWRPVNVTAPAHQQA